MSVEKDAMKIDVVEVGAVGFSKYVGNRNEIWSDLIGMKVTHSYYGTGRIISVEQRKNYIPLIYLSFDNKNNILFNSDSFKSGKTLTIEIPLNLYLTIVYDLEKMWMDIEKNLSDDIKKITKEFLDINRIEQLEQNREKIKNERLRSQRDNLRFSQQAPSRKGVVIESKENFEHENIVFKLCLFDLDNTLLRTSDLEKYRGYEFTGPQSNSYIDGLKTAFKKVPNRYVYTEEFLQRIHLQFGKLKLGIFTRSPRIYAETLIKLCYSSIHWDTLVAYEDVKNTKPHPEGVFLAMKTCSIKDSSQVIVVGDSKSDIVAAYRAGCWVVLDKSTWTFPLERENWYSLERIPDAIIESPQDLMSFIFNPHSYLPILERLELNLSLEFDTQENARIDCINHFNYLVFNEGKVPVYILGRIFARYEDLTNRYNWHPVSKDIENYKESELFPEYWLRAVHIFLSSMSFIKSGQETVIAVIPFKPGRLPRLEKFLKQLENYIQVNPIPNSKLKFIPDVMAYDVNAQSHHGIHLNKRQRFENVRDNLKVINRHIVFGKKVVVLDDVVTTGASLIYARKYLMESGASQVFCLALVKAINND